MSGFSLKIMYCAWLHQVEASELVMTCTVDMVNCDLNEDSDHAEMEVLFLLLRQVRRCYLNHLQKVLVKNYQSSLGEAANPHFSVDDVQRCAADMEQQAMHKCVVVVLYQRAMAKMITDIKKDTRKQKVYRNLRKFAPCRSENATQTDCIRDVKPVAVQTSSSLVEDCLPSSTEAAIHCRQQETDSQDASIKEERTSPPVLQQTPPPSPPALDEIPLPGTGPPQKCIAPQACAQDTTQCQVPLSTDVPTQTQSFEVHPPSSPLPSSLDTYSQQQTSSCLSSSLVISQQQSETLSNTNHSSIKTFPASNQLHPQLQHGSQHVSSLSGQSYLQLASQKIVSKLQQASQQQLSSLSGQSELQHTSQQNVSLQLQHANQQQHSSLSEQTRLQNTSQQNVSLQLQQASRSLSGQSQLQHTSPQQLLSSCGQSQLQIASQQQPSSLSGQSQLQIASQKQPSSSSAQVQLQHASQQQLSSLSGQSQLQNASQLNVSQLQNASQQQLSSSSGQSQLQHTNQQNVSLQLQHASQQQLSSLSGQSQLQHISPQQLSSSCGQSQLQIANQQQLSSLNAQVQLQHTSQQQHSSLNGQSQLQHTNPQQLPSLSEKSQLQHISQQQLSSFSGQSHLQYASPQKLSSLSGQLQLEHANQQHVSASGGQSQMQHASQEQILPLNRHSQEQYAIKQKPESLSSQQILQQTNLSKLEALDGQEQLQNVIQRKMESLSSRPQMLHEREQFSVSHKSHQHQASVQHVQVCRQSQSKTSRQPVKASSKVQLQSTSEKERQALALKHLQAAYEKWLQTASEQQRLIITQQQTQSSGQVLQSASQQKLQSWCLRRLRTAYQVWSQECNMDSLGKLQTAYVQWLDAATSRQPESLCSTISSDSSDVPKGSQLQMWPPCSLTRSSRPQQPVQPCVRPSQATVPVEGSSMLESQQIQVIDHQESGMMDWQFPSSEPGECGHATVANVAGSDAGPILQNAGLVQRYDQQGSRGVVQVEASPIPVVLSHNSGLQHKVHYHQQPCNPNNIEIIPVSEETLVKIEAEEDSVSEIPCSPLQTHSNTNPASLYCKESSSGVTLLSKKNDLDGVESKGNSNHNISKSEPVTTEKPVESDDDTQGSGPSPAFSSTDSETRSSTSSLESSESGRETSAGKEAANSVNEVCEEESMQPDVCIEVDDDFQTKLLLRELLSGGNTPTEELIEGTEIPYDAIVSGLEKLSSENVRKRKSETDLALPEKRLSTAVMDVDCKPGKEKMDNEESDNPGTGFWLQERLSQEKALVQRWRKLDCNVLRKARRKQRCIRLFGWDEDLVLTERELNICKGRIIPWIVRELKPYYRQGRVVSRPVFKSVARHTANRLVSQNCYPGECLLSSA
ncbi:hypothetical protein PR048_015422 [Dryococelus australis]|uniref:Uncharacterized protein n=1 Tax=Dryococelus australis TaxID=614101 RepID=A0ABQ9HGW9_9NEOP|nr:hypothetical protein PR048_015422 [Dryococelus australis]